MNAKILKIAEQWAPYALMPVYTCGAGKIIPLLWM
jgi:hypothetical protein